MKRQSGKSRARGTGAGPGGKGGRDDRRGARGAARSEGASAAQRSARGDARTAPHTARTPRPSAAPKGPRIQADLYGLHAVREAILNKDREISAIYAIEEKADEVAQWLEQATHHRIRRPDIQMPPREALDAALPREAVHQGVAVTCGPLPEHGLDDLLRDVGDEPAVFVILDQVTDPHNLGAIIRSACAFGARGMVVQRRHAPDIGALVAKTACGAAEHLPVAYETNLSRSIEDFKEAGFTIIGLDERGDIELPDLQAPARSVLVLGAEGAGLRRLVREGCDTLVRLPTHAPIESLNVSNAAAVALYHLLAK